MKLLLSGAFAAVAMFSLASFSPNGHPKPSPARQGPIRFVDLTMDRMLRTTLPVSGTTPYVVQMGSSRGYVITEVTGNFGVTIDVNGVSETISSLGSGVPRVLTPPIVFRPNDVVTLTSVYTGVGTTNITLGGFWTIAGET